MTGWNHKVGLTIFLEENPHFRFTHSLEIPHLDVVGLLGDVAGVSPGLCPLQPVIQLELGDRIDQLLWSELCGHEYLAGRIRMMLAIQRFLRVRSVRNSLPSGCPLFCLFLSVCLCLSLSVSVCLCL